MNDTIGEEAKRLRRAERAIHPLILERWSPRSLKGESIDEMDLMTLFEAARWAPSSYNNQPWRYIYAKRETPAFEKFLNLLVEFNRKWASKASVLGVAIAQKFFSHNQKPSITHQFDAGAAWQNLCLQGSAMGLVVHGMQGFDYAQAKSSLSIPDDYTVLAMFAIGKRAPKSELPLDLQERETPSNRKKIEEFVMEGKFRN